MHARVTLASLCLAVSLSLSGCISVVNQDTPSHRSVTVTAGAFGASPVSLGYGAGGRDTEVRISSASFTGSPMSLTLHAINRGWRIGTETLVESDSRWLILDPATKRAWLRPGEALRAQPRTSLTNGRAVVKVVVMTDLGESERENLRQQAPL
ncbi:hypothetical protein [Paludibacterium paludis]|uniref:DUF1425 domain-containing protein n=1 Tax=Paludibacterium paludis TaxID=1225769 RepID=A0A918P351_9NEIS|nr:hypothetical protein [Paludibacterium paludis]GGY16227.1 hypothetical protein GCM10011289_19310 [Paludibacterium paludis]